MNRELQSRHFLIELFRQEVQISLAGLGFLPTPEQIMLCQHLVREEHVNEKEASGAPQFSSRPEAKYVPNGQPLGDLGRDPVQLL